MAHSTDGDDDVDEKFNDIVARYGLTPGESASDAVPDAGTDDTPTPSSSHGVSDTPRPPRNATPVARVKPTSNAMPDGDARRRHPAGQHLDGDGEDFVPPTPPPLTAPDPHAWLTWIPALAGTMALLFMALFWRSAPTLAIVIAVVAALAGFVNFVRSLRTEPRDDDGAQV